MEPGKSLAWSRLADDQFSEHARQVGIIAAQSAILETEAEILFGELLGARYNQSKIIFYAVAALPPRLNFIQNLISDNYADDAEMKARWVALRKKIDSTSSERNRCIHAEWAENPKTHALQRRTTYSNGNYERRRIDLTVDDLKKVAIDLATVAAEINQFTLYVRDRPLSPSPSK